MKRQKEQGKRQKGGRAIRFAFCLLPFALSAAALADAARGSGSVGFVEITDQSRAAVDRGLKALAALQQPDGGWGGEGVGQRHTGITALATMAFMADGSLPDRGPYAQQVERGLQHILASAQETGLVAGDASHGPMYSHGFATLMLGEIYGMTGDRRCREALVKATRLIVTTQNSEGGWRYHPVPVEADISVTICQVMALRSARNAGLSVPKATIDRAIAYVRECQNPGDGGFKYMRTSSGSAFPRSAAGVAALYYAGVYEDEALARGLDYLLRSHRSIQFNGGGHYFYGHYYAAQAMYLAGGDYWAQWFPRIRDELVGRQNPDGTWASDHGDAYGTAMALIILQVPNRLLPIFQR